MDHIRHNSPSPIHCLRAFHILFFTYLLFRCYCYHHYKTPKNITFGIVTFYHRYHYYHITLLLNTLLQILSFQVCWIDNSALILENILWLPLCRINKFGLNTLPSKTVAIPYTCGLSTILLVQTRNTTGSVTTQGRGSLLHCDPRIQALRGLSPIPRPPSFLH